MDELDRRMREVLLELAFTSNGATMSFEASTSGGYYSDTVPMLGPDDAPHLHYALEYDRAESYAGRRAVFKRAEKKLKLIRHSIADPSAAETWEDFTARVLEDGEGMEAKRCAQWARSSERIIRRIREEAGRETEWGREPVNGHELSPEDQAQAIREVLAAGGTLRDAARALDLSYSTARRRMGRKD